MKAIILVAGKGSRMRPHTHTKAKPLLPIAGKPAIDHCIAALKVLPITEWIFITGHLKDQVEEHIRSTYDFPVRFIEQTTLDGTAGAIRLAKEYIDGPVVILFSDCIFSADLTHVHKSMDDGILWAQEVEDYQSFGVLVHDEQQYMTKIVEKPKQPVSKLANIGLYYIKNTALLFEGIEHIYTHDLKVNGEYFLPEAFMYMINQGAKLKIEPVRGWFDTGNPTNTLASNAALLQSCSALKSTPENSKIHQPLFIDDGCEIVDCELGPNVSIGKGCKLRNAVISNSIIDADSHIENISLHDSIIGQSTTLEGKRDQKVTLFLGDHSSTKL